MTDDRAQELLEVLARALRHVDPPPAHVVAAAQEAFAWRGIDTELAELVYDSATASATTVRSAETTRQMTFRAPGLEIEVEVVSERSRVLVGQLVPAQTATIELQQGGELQHADVDPLGRFAFDGVVPGPIKLTVRAASGATVQTEGLVI